MKAGKLDPKEESENQGCRAKRFKGDEEECILGWRMVKMRPEADVRASQHATGGSEEATAGVGAEEEDGVHEWGRVVDTCSFKLGDLAAIFHVLLRKSNAFPLLSNIIVLI